jgi:excisionase family DNA binding protein
MASNIQGQNNPPFERKNETITQESRTEYPEIMIRSEAASFLRMSERHLRWLINEGRIPEIRAGRRKRLYRKTALIQALDAGLY